VAISVVFFVLRVVVNELIKGVGDAVYAEGGNHIQISFKEGQATFIGIVVVVIAVFVKEVKNPTKDSTVEHEREKEEEVGKELAFEMLGFAEGLVLPEYFGRIYCLLNCSFFFVEFEFLELLREK
jgi:hypothetical protein